MPISKNRRNKRQMKPREFQTIKSARRYFKRFRWQFFDKYKKDKKLATTMTLAIKMSNS